MVKMLSEKLSAKAYVNQVCSHLKESISKRQLRILKEEKKEEPNKFILDDMLESQKFDKKVLKNLKNYMRIKKMI